MAFGFAVRNGAGQEVVFGNEQALHYWGRRSVTGSIQNNVIYSIPASWNAKVFVHCSDSNQRNSNTCVVNYESNRITVTTSTNSNATFTCYVFVPASRIPVGDYGLMLWGIDGQVAFNSSRPLLQFEGVTTVTTPASATATSIPVAAYCQQQTINAVPNFGINVTQFFLYTTLGFNNMVTTGVTIIGATGGVFGQPPVQHRTRVPYISTAHFNQFSSLGNP